MIYVNLFKCYFSDSQFFFLNKAMISFVSSKTVDGLDNLIDQITKVIEVTSIYL
jgi:predicted GTPase